MHDLTPEFAPRGGLLPLGCKDLLDVIQKAEVDKWEAGKAVGEALLEEAAAMTGVAMPQGVIEMGAEITVRELAERTGHKPYKFIKALISIEVFVANAEKSIPFDVAVQIGRYLGFEVKRVD